MYVSDRRRRKKDFCLLLWRRTSVREVSEKISLYIYNYSFGSLITRQQTFTWQPTLVYIDGQFAEIVPDSLRMSLSSA